MDLQSTGDKAVTSGNVAPPTSFRAYSPQTADESQPQPDPSASDVHDDESSLST